MRILYIGTGAIGLPTLRSLLTDGAHEVCGLICQPDKPVGRKQVLTPPATKVLALDANSFKPSSTSLTAAKPPGNAGKKRFT